jgi:hypothetical protein
MNRANLEKLAQYLLSDNLKAKFDMSRYTQDGWMSGHDRTDCGTVGCAAGHGPYAGIRKNEYETWEEYIERVFDLDSFSVEKRWCFGSPWAYTDNTPEGAGKRIIYMLKHGVPVDFSKQMSGKSPLCYR